MIVVLDAFSAGHVYGSSDSARATPILLTLGSLEALRAVGRAVTVLAPPELVLFLESEGVAVLRDLHHRPGAFRARLDAK